MAASVIVAGGVVALTFVLRSPEEVAVATSPPFAVPATQAVSTTESTSATEAAPTTETTSATAVSATSESPSVIPSATFVSGRASLRLPATWTRMEDPARMVLIPPTAPERRIVVTVQELVPGSTLEQVASELGAAVDARGPDSPIGSLEPARDFGGRVGISYVERPADASTVLWRVLVESDVQVSIGCQFEDRTRPRSTPNVIWPPRLWRSCRCVEAAAQIFAVYRNRTEGWLRPRRCRE